MVRTVAVDVGNRLVQSGDDLHRNDRREKLGRVIVFRRGDGIFQQRQGFRAAADFNTFLRQHGGHGG